MAASVAFLAISLMLAPISSAPVATVCRFWLTCSAALETTFGLRRGFLGVGGDLLAGAGQFLAGAGYVHRILRDGQDHAFQTATHLVDGRGQVAQFVLAADLQIVAGQVAGSDGFGLDQN